MLQRCLDHNVCAAVASSVRKVKQLTYSQPETNRICSLDETDEKSALGESPIRVNLVESKTLTQIIKESPFSESRVVLLDIDAEGQDLNILKTIDLKAVAPYLICIESLDRMSSKPLEDYLGEQGYILTDIMKISHIFMRSKSLKNSHSTSTGKH
jgi:hypothetical protein